MLKSSAGVSLTGVCREWNRPRARHRVEGGRSRGSPQDNSLLECVPALRRSSGRSKELGALDFAILREWSGESSTVLGHDPRLSPEVIAKRLRLGSATVRRRLTAWRDRGFLLGFDVLPHPGLLGGRLASRIIDFTNPIAQEKAIDSLSLIDGMVQIVPSRTMLCAVYFVDSESQAARRLKQLQAIEGTKEVGAEMRFDFPPCSRRMSRPDWRLVLALRRNPEAEYGGTREGSRSIDKSDVSPARFPAG